MVVLFIFIILLSITDIVLNLFGLIPYVGGVFETSLETINELIQICLAGIILFLGIKK